MFGLALCLRRMRDKSDISDASHMREASRWRGELPLKPSFLPAAGWGHVSVSPRDSSSIANVIVLREKGREIQQ